MGIEDMTKALIAEAKNQEDKTLSDFAKKAEKVAFAKFYIESKFGYNLSENRILEILKSMKTDIPQSSLNCWMHQIMTMLREKLFTYTPVFRWRRNWLRWFTMKDPETMKSRKRHSSETRKSNSSWQIGLHSTT